MKHDPETNWHRATVAGRPKPSRDGVQTIHMDWSRLDLGNAGREVCRRAGLSLTPSALCLAYDLGRCVVIAASSGTPCALVVRRKKASCVQPPARYGFPAMPYREFTGAIDALVAAGLVTQRLGRRGLGATELSPTEAFAALWWSTGSVAYWRVVRERGQVVLKDAKANGKRLLDFADTAETKRMQRHLDAINRHNRRFTFRYVPSLPAPPVWEHTEGPGRLMGMPASIRASQPAACLPPPGERCTALVALDPADILYDRIFNDARWDRGGRFTAAIQGLSEVERKTLRIDGQPTVELDYAGMQPTMLYDEAGLRPPGDPYTVPNLTRETCKTATLILLNAESRSCAYGALRAAVVRGKAKLPPGQTVTDVLDAMEQAHQPIARHFYSGVGMRLMNVDSDVAEGVMLRCVEAGIPCIGVHDSFIAPHSAEEQLRAFMVAEYQRVVGTKRVPKIKPEPVGRIPLSRESEGIDLLGAAGNA